MVLHHFVLYDVQNTVLPALYFKLSLHDTHGSLYVLYNHATSNFLFPPVENGCHGREFLNE